MALFHIRVRCPKRPALRRSFGDARAAVCPCGLIDGAVMHRRCETCCQRLPAAHRSLVQLPGGQRGSLVVVQGGEHILLAAVQRARHRGALPSQRLSLRLVQQRHRARLAQRRHAVGGVRPSCEPRHMEGDNGLREFCPCGTVSIDYKESAARRQQRTAAENAAEKWL